MIHVGVVLAQESAGKLRGECLTVLPLDFPRHRTAQAAQEDAREMQASAQAMKRTHELAKRLSSTERVLAVDGLILMRRAQVPHTLTG